MKEKLDNLKSKLSNVNTENLILNDKGKMFFIFLFVVFLSGFAYTGYRYYRLLHTDEKDRNNVLEQIQDVNEDRYIPLDEDESLSFYQS